MLRTRYLKKKSHLRDASSRVNELSDERMIYRRRRLSEWRENDKRSDRALSRETGNETEYVTRFRQNINYQLFFINRIKTFFMEKNIFSAAQLFLFQLKHD